MPNYSKTSIYKICCKDTTIKDIYIGSTCNFTKRKYQHKSSCHNENTKKYNFKVYQFIRDNGGWNNWDMIQIKEFNCENKREKETEERKYIEELKPTLNSEIPTRTVKEYHKDNKDKIKQYRLDNKERFKELRKEWETKNKEKINKRNKEYYIENKNEIIRKTREKYQLNKGDLCIKRSERYLREKEDLKQKIGCIVCKCMVNKMNFQRHTKSKKHLNNL